MRNKKIERAIGTVPVTFRSGDILHHADFVVKKGKREGTLRVMAFEIGSACVFTFDAGEVEGAQRTGRPLDCTNYVS